MSFGISQLENRDWNFKKSVTVGGGLSGANTPGTVFYVSRNKGTSGDGKSWGEAFKTIKEAIDAVNALYSGGVGDTKGRNSVIYVGEGWYAEAPIILTASDCWIIGTASGHHDSTVLYGVPVAGTFSGVAGGPTLTVTGSNNTIMNMGFYCSDPIYAAIRNGSNASDADALNPGASGPTGNAYINLSFVRDVADGENGGIDDLGNDGTLVEGCFFSTSCKTFGIRCRSNGVTNPVNPVYRNNRFVGVPTGIYHGAGHNLLIQGNYFFDDTSDRAGSTDKPLDTTNGGRVMMVGNYFEGAKADLCQGTTTSTKEVGNFCIDGIHTVS